MKSTPKNAQGRRSVSKIKFNAKSWIQKTLKICSFYKNHDSGLVSLLRFLMTMKIRSLEKVLVSLIHLKSRKKHVRPLILRVHDW